MTEPVARRAARVILLDAADRVLLLRLLDPRRPDEPYWLTPGGGLDPGEEFAAAALRELEEETGLRLPADKLLGPTRQESIEFPFDGVWYRQEQVYFLARVDTWAVVPTKLSEVEKATWLGARWWSAGELAASGERYYPPDLPEVLPALMSTWSQRGAVEC